jgi:serine/threonine-protein kinase
LTPERWQRLRQAIDAALEAPRDDRPAVLAEACIGDPLLLADARSILRAATDTRGFLVAPPTLTGDDADGPGEERPTLLGRTLGHYRIEERIGAGGMGEVFLAHDLALGRQSALKVLPRRVRSELRQRLIREAETAARLQHPAIATFFEAGEDQDETFIAMEFVRGETLRARLRRGPLPFNEWLALASCLLGALGHAHAAGVLHRDIKPENVMTTGPRSAKLLDFGLACGFAAAAEAESTISGQGAVVGTVGYMSPEQVMGKTLEPRSDLFQAGIVLYESLAGKVAFGGASPYERIAAIVACEVDLTVLAGRRLPDGLPAILGRALSRQPERRYPTAMAFLRELAALQVGGVATELPAILAVADFENLTRDPEADWLGAGIAEALVSALDRVPGLEIVPRPRVTRTLGTLRASGHASSPSGDLELGLALGCGTVLSGAYEKAGSALRIATRLTDVPTGRLIATEEASGTLGDLFALQDRLARSAMNGLRLQIPAPEPGEETREVRAFERVTRASILVTQLRREALEEAIGMLGEALDLDPGYAPAHAVLAQAHALRAIATTNPTDLGRTIDHADRAIGLDARNGSAYTWKGYALWRQERWEDAGRALRRGVELSPNDAQAHYFLGSFLFLEGVRPEALPYLQRSLEIEPLNGMGWLALGSAHLGLFNLAEAQYAFGRCLDLERRPRGIFPTAGVAGFLAETMRIEGLLGEGRQEALSAIEAAEASDHPYRDTFRAYGLCVLGRIALEQGDLDGVRAAYGQVIAQLRGRTRPRSCGHLMVQALAGLGRAGDTTAFIEALRLFECRETWDFTHFYGCLPEIDLFELARAAQALARSSEAGTLLARAREAGSREPLAP